MKRKYLKSTLFFCFLILIETILIKSCMYKILPEKYFYDSNRILLIMNGATNLTDMSYSFVANVFNAINFLNFEKLEQWGWFFGIIFSFVLIFILLKNKKYSITQYIFIYGSIALLNIYVFGLSKDIVQFVFFLAIYGILSSNLTNTKKLIFSCIILAFEAFNFRVYYLIMAMLMVTIYFIYVFFIRNKKLNKKSVMKIIIIAFIAFFAEVYVVQMISVDNYQAILLARSNVNQYREDSADAVTQIVEIFGVNNTYFTFIENYIANVIRMLLPFELLFIGPKYILFLIYQLFVTYNIFKMGKRINDRNIMWLITVISFIMVSAIFEPDFGSFVRHESTIILFLLKINIINNNEGEENLKDNKGGKISE